MRIKGQKPQPEGFGFQVGKDVCEYKELVSRKKRM